MLKRTVIFENRKSQTFHNDYFKYSFKKEMLQILKRYPFNKSICKSARDYGINPLIAMNWYIQGQKGNRNFKSFYQKINNLNGISSDDDLKIQNQGICQKSESAGDVSQVPEDDYVISHYGDGWSYKTCIAGEKIFIISGELEHLREKVKSRKLPLGD